MYCPNNPLCLLFQHYACETATTIDFAEAGDLSFQEETITETILLDLLRLAPPYLKIKAYAKQTLEPKTGADWNFLFTSETGNFRRLSVRIQAKRQEANGKYKIKISQLETLRNNRGNPKNMRNKVVPIYVFYGGQSAYHHVPSGSPGCSSNPKGYLVSRDTWGCSMASVPHVETLNTHGGKETFTFWPDQLTEHLPWHRLFCPVGTGNSDLPLPLIIRGNLKYLYEQGEASRNSPIYEFLNGDDESVTPWWFKSLRNRESNQRFDAELTDDNLNGVVHIHDTREFDGDRLPTSQG